MTKPTERLTASERHLRKIAAVAAVNRKRADAIRARHDFTKDETSGTISLTK